MKELTNIAIVPLQINTVILADDIYTTGSTVEACSRALRAAGVSRIYYVSICIVPEA